MATGNTLYIKNSIVGVTLSMTVSGNGWNCCDAPTPYEHLIDGLAPNSTQSFRFGRKDGHGCNGEQGYFVLGVEGNSSTIGTIGLNMDSDGNIGVTQPVPTGNHFACTVGPTGDGTYTAVFTSV